MLRSVPKIILLFILILNMTLPVPAAEGKMIALTFDDGPNPNTTEILLDGLAQRNAKATFFILGCNIDPLGEMGNRKKIETNISLVKRMVREGHSLGNHSYSHTLFKDLNHISICREIRKCNELIKAATGVTPVFIRPPGGSCSITKSSKGAMFPLVPVLWSGFDTLDWKYQDKNRILKVILENADDGKIILLHDPYITSVEAALEAIDILAPLGYEFVTVEDLLISKYGSEGISPGKIYYDGENVGSLW